MNRITHEVAVPLPLVREAQEGGLLSDLLTLTKARLTLLVVLTTFVGFCMAATPVSWTLLLHTTLGTAMAAAAAAVLNQVRESRVDRLMERTRHRPLPAGRIKRSTALMLGVVLALAGVAYLWLAANPMSAYLAATTVAIYLFFYTPLKRRSPLCTMVGAVSGAIPPLIGWTAARPSLDAGAWVLFGILFTWQMPHFLAIAWMYKDEYAQAGFVMLRRDDVSGVATALESLVFTTVLGCISAAPFFSGMTTSTYLGGALTLNALLFWFALQFLLERTRESARSLFFASIVFLPLLLALMVFTKA
ncbi:MAG: heme o synthase [Verrucomicrobiota bacterium]|nr:heme o synthase [Verrucomicrobiota bacterium]